MTDQTLRRARAVALFVGGFGGFIYELVADHGERPTILIMLAGMMGLPVFIPKPKAKAGAEQAAGENGGKP